ncbi:3-keto-disaccharide hydrolase [Bradyrhizobium sp.]|uniref:3-keto-disaccharide hydrolase n=1 Tax=Bradyrhizobium sp. TaxID=376 RepID=UPI003C679D04
MRYTSRTFAGTLVTTLVATLATGVLIGAAAESDGWVTLLDSSNKGDWNKGDWNEVGKANWEMKDGAVTADKLLEGKDPAYLVAKTAYKDFQIRAEFWVDEEANSGVFLRCEDPHKIGAKTCYEVNIYDKRPDPSYGTGAIVNVAKVNPMPKAAGKWNTYEITAQGPHLIVVLNGEKTVDVQDSTHLNAGPFALQYASGIVKFRKVQIKPL